MEEFELFHNEVIEACYEKYILSEKERRFSGKTSGKFTNMLESFRDTLTLKQLEAFEEFLDFFWAKDLWRSARDFEAGFRSALQCCPCRKRLKSNH